MWDPLGLKWVWQCFGEDDYWCEWVWLETAADSCPQDGCEPSGNDPSDPLGKDPVDKKAANNGTPQNPTTAHCVGQALAAKGLSIALDIAGAVPAFGNLFSGTVEGIQALNAGYYGTVALANAGNTLLNPSASGAASTAATIGLTVGSLALNGSKVIPVVGNLVSLGTAVYDTTKAVQAYQQCMAGGG